MDACRAGRRRSPDAFHLGTFKTGQPRQALFIRQFTISDSRPDTPPKSSSLARNLQHSTLRIDLSIKVGLQERFAEDLANVIQLEFAPAEQHTRARSPGRPKRAMDVVLGLLFLCLFSPILLLIPLLIRLDSRGPALFRQTRLGLSGQPFEILKFRTMTVLENGEHVVQATRNDPRVTRLGRFLRKSSLDELPQLFNVLKGEMSLVGPRPHARAHDAYYGARIPAYERRQLVKPGITGWAQVNGHRGETPTLESMRQRVELDLWYVENASAGLDLEILVRTVFELFRQRNAH
jgi:exopolysaccharide biosynthesis polyprenyl glycosylphosphotransferase